MFIPDNIIIVPVTVVIELIIGGQCDEASPARWQTEEYLNRGIHPHLQKQWDGEEYLPIISIWSVDGVVFSVHAIITNQINN